MTDDKTKDKKAKKPVEIKVDADQEGASPTPGMPLYIHAQYIKDMSFENPNAPEALENNKEKPEIEVDIDMAATKLEHPEFKDYYEVTLTLSATAKREDMTLFIAEIIYAAAVVLKNVPENQHHPMLLSEVPRYLFPFARQLMANVTQYGAYPPLWLNPVNFHAMYVSRFGDKIKKTG